MLSLIIPTVNEAENLCKLLPLVKPLCDEIVVVDDASRDDTVAVAKSFGCTLVERPGLMGCGSAVYDGVRAAKHDVIAIMDADFSHPPQMLHARALVEHDLVDVVKFSRFSPGGGMENKTFRYYAFWVYNVIMRFILGVRAREITGGFMIAKKDCYASGMIGNTSWGLGFMRFNRHRRIAEVPYVYAERRVGVSKNTDGARIVGYFLEALRVRFTMK